MGQLPNAAAVERDHAFHVAAGAKSPVGEYVETVDHRQRQPTAQGPGNQRLYVETLREREALHEYGVTPSQP